MSARKLSRIAGMVFVLAAVIGGVSATATNDERVTGGSADAGVTASHVLSLEVIWN